jgi:hypothetical protein
MGFAGLCSLRDFREPVKKSPALGRAVRGKIFGSGSGYFCLWNVRRDIEVVRSFTLDAEESGSTAQHAVELFHHEINRFVEVLAGHLDNERFAADLNVPFSGKFFGLGNILGVAKFKTYADDMFLMIKKFRGFFPHDVFESFREFEVVTGDDDIIRTSVHGHVSSLFVVYVKRAGMARFERETKRRKKIPKIEIDSRSCGLAGIEKR